MNIPIKYMCLLLAIVIIVVKITFHPCKNISLKADNYVFDCKTENSRGFTKFYKNQDSCDMYFNFEISKNKTCNILHMKNVSPNILIPISKIPVNINTCSIDYDCLHYEYFFKLIYILLLICSLCFHIFA